MAYDAMTGQSTTLAHVGAYRIVKNLSFNWFKSKTETRYHVVNQQDDPRNLSSKEIEAWEPANDPLNRFNFTTRKAAETYLCSILGD